MGRYAAALLPSFPAFWRWPVGGCFEDVVLDGVYVKMDGSKEGV
jgi:hypothetical protein